MLKNYYLMRFIILLLACFSLSLSQGTLAQSGPVASGKVEMLWLGQAGWRIKTPTGKQIVIDPWITGGPKAPQQFKNDLSALGPVDLLLVTHAHVDHIGDAPNLAKLHNTVLYGPADMVTPLITLGIIPANLGYRFNKIGRAHV